MLRMFWKLLGSRQLWVQGLWWSAVPKTRTVSQKLAAACCLSLFKPETANSPQPQAVRPVGPNSPCAMAEMKQEDLLSQGQAQEAPMKSEEEKPEGGASPEPKALHPAGDDTQKGLPFQAGTAIRTTGREGQPPEVEA